MKQLKFKTFSASVQIPIRSSKENAGYDLFSNNIINYYSCKTTKTDIGIKILESAHGRKALRSNLAFKNRINFRGDFAGEVKVILFNHSSKSYKFYKKLILVIVLPRLFLQ